MLPENRLSTSPVPFPFMGARELAVGTIEDFEMGGVALQDPREGIDKYSWRGWIETDDELVSTIWLQRGLHEGQVVYVGFNITELSFTFDRNMNECLAFVEDGIPKLRWYDTTISDMTTTSFGSNVITPRVSHDDKREAQSGNADIVLAYMRDGKLFLRYQRNRYSIEYDPTEDVPEPQRTEYRQQIANSFGLIKIGMNTQNRLQFMFRMVEEMKEWEPIECPIG